MRRTLFAAALAAAFSPVSLIAQGDCEAPKGSNVARMLSWFEGPLAFAPSGPARRLERGTVRVGGDLTWVPTPPSSITRTDVCYTPKAEHTGLAPVFPRARVIVGLGGGLSLEAMYLPPVTIAEATPNLGSVALGWVRPLGSAARHLDLTLRAHATLGQVQGPITCPKSAIQQTNPSGVCWGGRASKDTYRPNSFGAELGVASSAGALRWYGGLGVTSLRPRFQVGFTFSNGVVDNTKVHVDLTRVAAFGGVGFAAMSALELTAQLYSVPEDATTLRAGLIWRLR